MEFEMQKKTKLMLAAGTVGLLAIGGVAGLASADMGGHRMWGMGHGMGGGMMGMQMMERYDGNKDGKISQQEIDQNRTSWHGEFDGDKNSTLSIDEFQNLWLKARREQMVREFQAFDRDGNGQITLEEYTQPTAGIVANRDRNGDGFLSREDRPQRGDREGRRGMGHGMGHGMGMGQGMGHGQGMMNDNDDDAEDGAQTPPPPAPANP
jgi:Ca2+-binding EF-hand superfamily protein